MNRRPAIRIEPELITGGLPGATITGLDPALIQNKATLVRVYFVNSQNPTFNNGGSAPGIAVQLRGFRNDNELENSPLAPLSEPLAALTDFGYWPAGDLLAVHKLPSSDKLDHTSRQRKSRDQTFTFTNGTLTGVVGCGNCLFTRGYATFLAISNGSAEHEIGHALDRPHHNEDPDGAPKVPEKASNLRLLEKLHSQARNIISGDRRAAQEFYRCLSDLSGRY